MDKILCLVLLIGQILGFPKKEIDSELELQASAKNARYYFSADVDDEVSDVKSHRHELRFGVEVIGSFSYSDGFVLREVIYSAGQDGYKVISDKIENLPKVSDSNTLNTTKLVNSTYNISSDSPLQRLPLLKKTKV